mgnify:CR=1 FL=1
MSNTNTTQNSGQWRLIDADQVLDMVLGDTEFLDEMIDLFLSTVPEQMCEISLAIERKEAAALASTAHGFKVRWPTTLKENPTCCCRYWKMTESRIGYRMLLSVTLR